MAPARRRYCVVAGCSPWKWVEEAAEVSGCFRCVSGWDFSKGCGGGKPKGSVGGLLRVKLFLLFLFLLCWAVFGWVE